MLFSRARPPKSRYFPNGVCTELEYSLSSLITLGVTHSASNNPAQGIPGSAVKPVEEIVVSIHSHIVGGAIVEPAMWQ